MFRTSRPRHPARPLGIESTLASLPFCRWLTVWVLTLSLASFFPPGPGDVRVQPARGEAVLVAMADVGCVDLPACRIFGWCSDMDDASCAANDDDDCMQSEACADYGSCHAFRGVCLPIATTSSDCFVPRGADFVSPCADLGLCDVVDGVCYSAARTDADCLATGLDESSGSPCSSYGACVARGGVCVAERDAHCRAAKVCAAAGRCASVRGWCAASSSESCEASSACKEKGECLHVRGSCLASLADCLEVPACFENDVYCQVDSGRPYGHCYWPIEPFTF